MTTFPQFALRHGGRDPESSPRKLSMPPLYPIPMIASWLIAYGMMEWDAPTWAWILTILTGSITTIIGVFRNPKKSATAALDESALPNKPAEMAQFKAELKDDIAKSVTAQIKAALPAMLAQLAQIKEQSERQQHAAATEPPQPR